MKIKLLISRATATGAENRNDIIDVPADEAKRMIDAGQAEVVRTKPAEKAVKASNAEKASK